MRNFTSIKWAVMAAMVSIGFSTAVSAQIRTSRATTNQTRSVITRLETKTDQYRRLVDTAIDRSPINNTNREDRITDFINDFETATDSLRSDFDGRREINSNVQNVLERALFIDRFMTRNRLTTRAQRQWTSIRTDLNTLARLYNVSWNWSRLPDYNAGYPSNGFPSTGNSNRQAVIVIASLETKTDQFRRYTQASIDRSPINGTNREDRITDFINNFESSTDALRRNFDAGQNIDADVQNVLQRALFIDSFMTRNRLSVQAENQWTSMRKDLDSLARLYNVSWNWNRVPDYNAGFPTDRPTLPNGNWGGRGLDSRLTGTYRLNRSQSDDINNILGKYDSTIAAADRDRVRRAMERRLTSPDMLAIEKVGNTVNLASSLSPQVTFEADGVAKTETTRNGRTIRTTASANRDSLLVSYEGDRANDFYLTFAPAGDGQLRVTRKLYLENENQTVSVTSVYDKINNVAQWSSIETTGGNWSGTGTGAGQTTGDFYIPNGTRVIATLRNAVNAQVSQVGDRFTMDVSSPNQYRGAVIEGRITNAERSGRVSGRASLSFDFDSIRMPNGTTYRFAGNIDSVRAANGDNVSVNNEGTVRDSNQTTKTVTRAGIGAALGALIGAIAGGGQGAAVGAAVGAGAGAGTVFIQGRDNIDLAQGSEFTITASAPANVGTNRNYR
ncbi:MAG: hypothetical protein ABI791_09290 [Acidobacteriota bacterium]